MKITNKQGLSSVWVHAVEDDYDQVGWRSVTGLIKPPQMANLINKYGEFLSEDVDDRIWSLFGSACHYVLAKAARKVPDSISEIRFVTIVRGKEIGFKPDLLIPIGGGRWRLHDFKFPSVWAIILNEHSEWFQQANLYSHLLTGRYELFRVLADGSRIVQPAINVTSASIEVAIRDWSMSDSLRQHDYPKTKTQVIPVPLWPEDKCAEFLLKRVQMHIEADAGHPQPCNDIERWARPDKYAVKKPNAQKALKVFETKMDADRFADAKGVDYRVEYRPGENIRCSRYCSAARICPQYQKLSNAEEF